jgi:hypothetical protein
MKRPRAKLSITIENIEISQLEEEIELPKGLKSLNHKILIYKTEHKFVKNSSILILLIFLELTYKMLHLLFWVKNSQWSVNLTNVK